MLKNSLKESTLVEIILPAGFR